MSDEMNGLEALAWIAWRSPRAVRYFGTADGEAKWKDALAGRWPKRLGRPIVTPRAAEEELKAALSTGTLSYRINRG
jgi:hypothetical protein